MTTLIAGIDQTKPTELLKGVDTGSIPEVSNLTADDMKRYVFTGISAIIDTPLVKNSRNALLAVNIDGFIPVYNFLDPYWGRIMYNMFPVQAFSRTLSTVSIRQEQIALPSLFNYCSHRFIGGNVGIGIRVSSNTAQTGNLMISQASGVARNYYSVGSTYQGLRFSNASENQSDYGVQSFVLGDISLNRNISITPIRRDPTIKTDLAQKIIQMTEVPVALAIEDIHKRNTVASQFLEDWILIGILTNLPNSAASQITLSFFFDFSNVQFYTPMLPIIPFATNNFGKQFLNITASFAVPSLSKAAAVWIPGGPGLVSTNPEDGIDE